MPTLNDFIKDTQTLGYADRHVRAFSGRSTVGRIPGSVTGLERFFCPPFAAGELAMTIDVEITSHGLTLYDRALMGHEIPQQLLLQAERWHPSYIWRKGTFHRHTDQGLASLTVETSPALALPPVNENGGGWLEAGDIRFHPKTKTVVFPAKLLLWGIVFVDLVAISGAGLPMVAVGLVLFSLILLLQRNIPATRSSLNLPSPAHFRFHFAFDVFFYRARFRAQQRGPAQSARARFARKTLFLP